MRHLVLAFLLVAVAASGQVKPQPAKPAAPPAVQPPAAAAPPAYAYNPENRRDPFVSLLRRGRDTFRRPDGKPLAGLGSLLINEIALKGVLQSRGTNIALVQGVDNKTYLVRANDRLLDGFVKAITADALILMQDVNDPLSVTKQREVRKSLRGVVEQK
jgi:Tfp pilus assembly protein PilP